MKKQASLKITHDDPKKAKEMADTLVKFANKLAVMMGEKPDAKIIEGKDEK